MFSVNNWDIGHVWIAFFIMIYTFHGVHSSPTPEFRVLHQFTAYDCERPLSVEALQLPSHCLDHKTDNDITDTKTNLTLTDNQPYQLLQKATYHEFDAHVCKQSRSKLFYSCMWVSHSVINVAPQTGRQIDTTLKFCSQAIRTPACSLPSPASWCLSTLTDKPHTSPKP